MFKGTMRRKKGLLLALSALLGIGGISAVLGAVDAHHIDQEMRAESAAFDFSKIYSSVTSSQDFESTSIDPVTVSAEKVSGSNNPKYYSNGSALRLYNKTELTVSTSANYYLTSIAFTTASNGPTSSNFTCVSTVGSLTGLSTSAATSWSWAPLSGVQTQSAVFTITATIRIATITVNYNALSYDSVESVTVDPTTASIETGATTTLSATVLPATADPSVTWSSDNTGVATVDETTGEVTGVAVGTANITATTVGTNASGETVKASCAVTVTQAAVRTTYSYTFESKVFDANETLTLNNVAWTLDGTFQSTSGAWNYDSTKGQQFGTGNNPYATMTLSTNGIAGIIKSVKVNTSGASSISATLDVTVGGVTFGKQISLTSTATDYTFEGTGVGEIVLSFANSSKKAMYVKTIEIQYSAYSEVTGVTISPETVADIETGATTTLSATVAPADANPNVTWSSDNTGVATVDANGVVTGVSAGTATITATAVGTVAEGGSGTATKTITVVAPAKTLSDIAITNNPSKMSYVVSEAISYEGILVTATYSDKSTEEIGKDGLTFSVAEGTRVTDEHATAGKIEVVVTYAHNTGTKTRTLELTVSEATRIYTKVTSAADLELGASYTFGYVSDNSVTPVAAKSGTNDFYSPGTSVYTSDGSMFLDNDNILEFTLAPGASSDTYALWSDTENGYIGFTGSTGGTIPTSSSFDSTANNLTITFAENTGNISIAIDKYLIKYNSGSSKFAFYSGSYAQITLYKRYEPANAYYTNATSWADAFLSATGTYCQNVGSIKGAWDEQIAGNYALDSWVSGETKLTTQIEKDFIIRGVAAAQTATTGSSISLALARYDYCVSTYGLTGFLTNRTVVSNAVRFNGNNDQDSSYIALVAIASMAGVVSTVFLIRKKKASREEEE